MIKDEVSIRPLELADLKFLHKWRNDKEIFDNLGGGYFPKSYSEMSEWMPSIVRNTVEQQRFLILFENNEVGFISLTNINHKNGTSELGLYLGEKNYLGKGIAKKALNILIDYAKNTLNLRKISLNVLDDNDAAIHLYKKVNFVECGLKREERYVNGTYKNLLLMEVFL